MKNTALFTTRSLQADRCKKKGGAVSVRERNGVEIDTGVDT